MLLSISHLYRADCIRVHRPLPTAAASSPTFPAVSLVFRVSFLAFCDPSFERGAYSSTAVGGLHLVLDTASLARVKRRRCLEAFIFHVASRVSSYPLAIYSTGNTFGNTSMRPADVLLAAAVVDDSLRKGLEDKLPLLPRVAAPHASKRSKGSHPFSRRET